MRWIQFDESRRAGDVPGKGRPPAAGVEADPFSARERRIDDRISGVPCQRMGVENTFEHGFTHNRRTAGLRVHRAASEGLLPKMLRVHNKLSPRQIRFGATGRSQAQDDRSQNDALGANHQHICHCQCVQVAEHCTDGSAAYLRQAGQRDKQGRPTDEPFHLAQCDEMRFHGHREYSDEQDSQYPIDFVDVPTSEQGQDRTRRHQEEHVCAESRGHGEDERESGPGREGSRRMGGDSVQRRAQRERDHVHQTGEHGCDVKIGVRRRGEQYRNDEGQHRSGHRQGQVEGVVLQGASAQVTQHL